MTYILIKNYFSFTISFASIYSSNQASLKYLSAHLWRGAVSHSSIFSLVITQYAGWSSLNLSRFSNTSFVSL